METYIKFSQIMDRTRCPVCASIDDFSYDKANIICASCKEEYPIVNGIPILIDEAKCIFKKTHFTSESRLFFDTSESGRRISAIGRFLSSVGGTTGTKNYEQLRNLLKQRTSKPRVLVLGGSIAGQGMDHFLADSELEIVESDMSFGPRTQIILDAHNIPYQDASFDCVIAQAVLEHVLNPFRCVAEIHRVLKPDGLVYAETPFMQQVHGGAYDFLRFTHSGHRRLLNHFEEIDSGAIAGAGTAMLWSYQYLLLALFGFSRSTRLFIKAFSRLTGFWLRFLDHLTTWNPYSIEAASGFYFIGRKSNHVLSDEEIVKYYEQTVHKKRV